MPVSNGIKAGIRTIADVRNLELKVRCPNEEALDALMVRARAVRAVYVRTMGQRDINFRVPRGRLKLREWWLDGDQAQGGERVVARPSEQWGQQCRFANNWARTLRQQGFVAAARGPRGARGR